MLEVRVFGGLALRAGGEELTLPADARARELLAWLALHPGLHGRSTLAGVLRPDVSETSARQTLRNAAYELRRALGAHAAGALVATRDAVGLADAAVTVDAREFARLAAAGELEAAVALGRAQLLTGLDADWALRARDEHAAALAGALQALAGRAEATGELAAAVAWARERLEVEPLAEQAHRELVRLLARSGDRAAALVAARALSERLRSELGIAPSAQTRALVDDVQRGRVAHDAAAAAPDLPLPGPLAAARRPEGRAPALARLRHAWAEATGGARTVALISGEPGIGKTTLAAELARHAGAQGAAVLLGRCEEQALLPFQPWIEALERLLAALPAPDAEGWLTAHDGALARLLPARSTAIDGIAGPRERFLAFELARALLEDVAARAPVLLVLDDVHWADADSLSLLRHVARSTHRARLLVLLCARPGELQPGAAQLVADLRREGPLEHIQLDGLDDDAVTALLVREGQAADRDRARRLRARSGGNPLLLGELLRAARETADADLPAGVRDLVARRLARLGEPTRRALEVAAACGPQLDVAVVAAVLEQPLARVLEALDGAVDAGLIAATGDRGGQAFAHALVAEAIASSLPVSQRAQLHRRIAAAMAGRHAGGDAAAAEVARHLRCAGPLAGREELARWELAAAREATAALAHADAAGHYEAALAALAPAPAGERPEVLLALGHAHDRAGRRDPARAAFAEAAAAARAHGDPARLARAALGHGGTAVVVAAADPATVRLLEEALAAAPAREPATSARLLARLAIELYYADPARARELSALAVERARRCGDPSALAAALNGRRVALWSPHHAAERAAVAGEMVAAAERAGDREALLQARNWRVVDLLELGRVAEASAEVGAYEELAAAVGLPHFSWYAPLWRGALALLAGRWEEAERLSERALELGRRADDPNAPLFVGVQREHSQHMQWRFGEIDRARLVAGAAASPISAGWQVHVALLDAEQGRLDRARRMVADLARDGARAIPMDANWHAACVLAEAAVAVGDRDAGATLHALLEPHARLSPVIARAAAAYGTVEHQLGLLAGLLGRPDEAQARLRQAIADDERAGAAPHAAATLLRLGELLAGAGDHDGARTALAEAAARAEALAMPALAERAQRLLAVAAA